MSNGFNYIEAIVFLEYKHSEKVEKFLSSIIESSFIYNSIELELHGNKLQLVGRKKISQKPDIVEILMNVESIKIEGKK